MPVPNERTRLIDNMYTYTWEARRDDVVNQIFKVTPFWAELTSRQHMRDQIGGKWIEQPIMYGKNDTVTSFDRGDSVPISRTEHSTMAEFLWKYLSVSITRFMPDEQKNRGKAQIKSMVTQDIDNAQSSAIDYLEEAVCSDGSGNDGKDIDGLLHLVPPDPTTGTVGAISRANNEFWRSHAYNMSGENVGDNLQQRMKRMFNDCGHFGSGVERFPTLIYTDQTTYESYEDELVDILRITTNKWKDLGFGDLSYKGRPLTWSPQCPAGYMWFLNMAHIFITRDPGYWFDMGDWKEPANQPRTRVAQIIAAMNLTVKSLNRHGLIYNIGVGTGS